MDMLKLCEFLTVLKVGSQGLAFVAERRKEMPPAVIAYPSADMVWRTFNRGTRPERENIPVGQIEDARVRTFMTNLPKGMDPGPGTEFVPVELSHDGIHYIGGYENVHGEGTPDWIVCSILPEREIMENAWRNNWIHLGIGALIVVMATAAGVRLSRNIARPLAQLVAETKAISSFDCEPRPAIQSIVQEVVDLGVALEEMKTGLRSFRKYVPADLVRNLLLSKQTAVLGGLSRMLTIFFCDIVDFTTIAEKMDPYELVEHLREYLGVMSAQVTRANGTVDKYIGDAIMAFWGARCPTPATPCTPARPPSAATRPWPGFARSGKPKGSRCSRLASDSTPARSSSATSAATRA